MHTHSINALIYLTKKTFFRLFHDAYTNVYFKVKMYDIVIVMGNNNNNNNIFNFKRVKVNAFYILLYYFFHSK